MKKLLTKLKIIWSSLRGVPALVMALRCNEKLREECDGRRDNMARAWDRVDEVTAQRDEYERELRLLQMEPSPAMDQLMQLRVHGMARNGVIGYGVTAFIPEDVLAKVRALSDRDQQEFIGVVAENLVARAIKGLWYRTPQNNVAALVFDKEKLHAVAMIDANGAPRIAARAKATLEAKQPAAIKEPASIWNEPGKNTEGLEKI